MTTHDEYRAALDRVDEAIHRLRAAELRLGTAICALKEVTTNERMA